MSRPLTINFAWPFVIGAIGLILSGSLVVKAIIGTVDGSYALKNVGYMFLTALVIGGISWLFIKVAQANKEADEEAEA